MLYFLCFKFLPYPLVHTTKIKLSLRSFKAFVKVWACLHAFINSGQDGGSQLHKLHKCLAPVGNQTPTLRLRSNPLNIALSNINSLHSPDYYYWCTIICREDTYNSNDCVHQNSDNDVPQLETIVTNFQQPPMLHHNLHSTQSQVQLILPTYAYNAVTWLQLGSKLTNRNISQEDLLNVCALCHWRSALELEVNWT